MSFIQISHQRKIHDLHVLFLKHSSHSFSFLRFLNFPSLNTSSHLSHPKHVSCQNLSRKLYPDPVITWANIFENYFKTLKEIVTNLDALVALVKLCLNVTRFTKQFLIEDDISELNLYQANVALETVLVPGESLSTLTVHLHSI